jgi:branched-subunit amino acid aminotransferase/4-amino-4-deoxychorismate lyase
MTDQAWVDGRMVVATKPALVVGDRGFQLGDGAFETLRVRRGVAIELELHLARLREGLDVLAIPLPWSDTELATGIAAVVAASAPEDAAVRLTVSRGAPTVRGLLPTNWRKLTPTVVIQAWPHVATGDEILRRGVRAIVATGRRDPTHPLAAVKTISRADRVHARIEAELAGVEDSITLTLDGHVAEATSANVVAVVGRSALTPPLAAGILAGTTRDWLLRPEGAAALGLEAAEAWLLPGDLLAADEVLLCSSVAGFLPLVELDGVPIGGGAPGPWAGRLRAAREAWIEGQAGG